MSNFNPNILDECLEGEIWKAHPSYPLYEGSNFGRVRNCDNKKIKIQFLDKRYNRWGFMISQNNKGKRLGSARFILSCFEGENKGLFVDHIDSDPSNNFLSNLRYVTRIENNNNPNSRAKYTPSKRTNDTTKVNCYNLDGSLFKTFASIKDAVEFLGYPRSSNIGANITAVCAGRQITAYGYKWSYVEEPLLEGEIFKKHPTLDIEVSNMGRIMFKRINGQKRITYGGKHTCGYLAIQAPNTSKKFLVHRLVAEVFIPNKENKPFVNHINANIFDNRSENLEWCDASGNMMSEETHKKLSFVVDLCNIDGKVIKTYSSERELCRQTGLCRPCVRDCLSGKSDNFKGYKFKYHNKILKQ